MWKKTRFIFLVVNITFIYFILLDIIFIFIHCLRIEQKEKKVTRKQLTKTRGGAFRGKGKQTVSNKKNCYKCAGDCECISI